MAQTTNDERTIDEKGRVTIPQEAREALGLGPGADVRIGVEDDRIVIQPQVSREEFIEVMEGCITEETVRDDAEEVDPMDPLGLDDPLGRIE
jgi:AbrB family looped-hinge helix DNA binding protein